MFLSEERSSITYTYRYIEHGRSQCLCGCERDPRVMSWFQSVAY